MTSISSLDTLITCARKDAVISEAEVGKIIKAAGKSISNREAKAIGGLFESRIENLPRFGYRVPLATPHNPHVGFEASQAFNSFFVKRNLPFGDRGEAMRDEINRFLSVALLGPGSEVRPNINHLPTLDLQPGLLDAPHMTAHVDVRKKQLWLSRSGGGLLPPGVPTPKAQYWGPLALPAPTTPITVSDERKAKLQRTLDAHKATASWSIQSNLLNERTVQVKLNSDDTYNYTAIIPVGRTDPSPALDPNTVMDFVVMRMPKVIPPNVRMAPAYTSLHVDPRDV